MKKLLLILLCLPMIGFGQQTYVPDDNFEAYLEANGMGNGIANDDYVTTADINSVTALYVAFQSISDLTGIEDFIALDSLNCYNNQLTSLDVSSNTALTHLQCFNNQLTSLDVSNNIALFRLDCDDTQLTSLDLSNNIALGSLDCNNNQLTSLDVSNNIALGFLGCGYNQLTSLDLSNNIALGSLDCNNNQLTSLDVSNNIALGFLGCGYNQLTSLDLSNNISLSELDCNNNQLISLDVSQSVDLISLECQSNLLECLDISNNPALTEVNFQSNLLEQLNLKNGNWSILEPNALSNNLTCVEVDNIGYATNNWTTGFDSFVTFSTNCNYTNPCATVSAIQEHTTNKELLKVTDLLGRETKQTNQPLFYIYDDGTVEKRIVIE
jgi:hypothetical protein